MYSGKVKAKAQIPKLQASTFDLVPQKHHDGERALQFKTCLHLLLEGFL